MRVPSPSPEAQACSLLEDLLDDTALGAAAQSPLASAAPLAHQTAPSTTPPTTPFAADILDTQHPHNPGRVLVAWAGGQAWLPTLRGLSLRVTDRVLVVPVVGLSEPVVSGVIDGLGVRPETPRTPRAALLLKPDETLRIETQNGAPLLEVFEKDGGPVVRLLARDATIDVPGVLTMTADKIALCARKGDVRVEASDSVVVRGEDIRLN